MKTTPDAVALFEEHFGSSPRHLVKAPGRLELLGNHTDYNEGLVMALAVDRYIQMAASPRTDGRVALVSSAFQEREEFAADRIEKNQTARWADYVKGVLAQLRQRGVHFGGFNAAIHGTIPVGAGMSSSAALEVATALALRRLYPYALTGPAPTRDSRGDLPPVEKAERMELAKLCQAAESQFVGVNCGLLDQISSLFGRAGHVIQIDCRFNAVEHDPMPSGIAVAVCESGVRHELSAGEYNEMRRHCESAARALGVSALRSVDPSMLEKNRAKLTPREYECAYHVVGENQRVVYGQRALRDGDIAQFGQYLFQSHESSRDFFKNSCPELDVLVELARAHRGCIGARLTGGGFGGATINLVHEADAGDFSAHMSQGSPARSGKALTPLICRIVDGAE